MASRRVNNSKTFQVFTHLPSNMGRRAEEIRPVGAYVESAQSSVTEVYSAVNCAQEEEFRLQQLHEEKQRRLRQFQEDVKLRVHRLEKLKREQQLQKSYQAVEEERNIVRQTAFAAENLTSRRNHLSARSQDLNHSINVPHGSSTYNDPDVQDDIQAREITKHSTQVKQYSKHARQNLTSRKVAGEREGELPGGEWKGKQVTPVHPFHAEDADEEGRQGVVIYAHQDEDGEDGKENAMPDVDITEVKTVRFDDEEPQMIPVVKKEKKKKVPPRPQSVPDVRPGVLSEEERVRVQRQRAMYRRLFMDIEREQVKEQNKKREHRKNIHRLKREKEDERKRVEFECERLVAPTDPITGETAEETVERKRIEAELLEGSREEQRRRVIRT